MGATGSTQVKAPTPAGPFARYDEAGAGRVPAAGDADGNSAVPAPCLLPRRNAAGMVSPRVSRHSHPMPSASPLRRHRRTFPATSHTRTRSTATGNPGQPAGRQLVGPGGDSRRGPPTTAALDRRGVRSPGSHGGPSAAGNRAVASTRAATLRGRGAAARPTKGERQRLPCLVPGPPAPCGHCPPISRTGPVGIGASSHKKGGIGRPMSAGRGNLRPGARRAPPLS